MLDALEFLKDFIIVPYLIAILCLGKILTSEAIQKPLPLGVKTFLDKLGAAWIVLILSFIMGLIWYYIKKEAGDKTEAEILIVTYLIANSVYALFVKAFFEWIENTLTKK